MQLELETHGVHASPSLRPRLERGLRQALGRFAHRVRRVLVRVTDLNGPRGGVDVELRIEARLDGAPDALVTQVAATPEEALGRGADRIRRAVRRSLARASRRRRAPAWERAS